MTAAYQTLKITEVEKNFDNGVSKAELLGVCRISETEVQCWNGDGGSAEDLQTEVRNSFMGESYRNVPIRFGQKTRIAFFKITNPPYNDTRGSLDAYFQSNQGNFDLNRRSSSSMEGEPRVEVKGTILMTPMDQETASVSTSFRQSAKPSDRIPVKPGAAVTYLGTKYTIRKIVKNELDPTFYMQVGGGRWAIAMTAERSDPLAAQIGWVALDTEGLAVRVVDKDGNPVYADPSTLNNVNMGNLPGRPNVSVPKIFPAQITAQANYGVNSGDDYPIYTNINPAKIKAIYAYGSTAEKIVIKGIPLDPKR